MDDMWNVMWISLCLILWHTMNIWCRYILYGEWFFLVIVLFKYIRAPLDYQMFFCFTWGTLCFLCLDKITYLFQILIYAWQLQIPHLRPAEYKRSRLPRNRRTVNRAYGGVLSGSAVRERFVLLYFYSYIFIITRMI